MKVNPKQPMIWLVSAALLVLLAAFGYWLITLANGLPWAAFG